MSKNIPLFSDIPAQIKLVEVGPRDGLQNENVSLSVATRIEFIEKLADCGLRYIEAGSFVYSKKIPQLIESAQVITQLRPQPNVVYAALVPNLHGLEDAIAAGVREVSFFTTVSETFCQKNINCSIAESLERLAMLAPLAQKNHIKIRAYISCVLGCPYEGKIPFEKTAKLAEILTNAGCYEVSLGDTIGVGTPHEAYTLIQETARRIPLQQIAVHFHNTYGQALANILVALQLGVHVIDSSVAGLGGCPYAKGASGNVSTEDVVYMLHGLGLKTGVDLAKLSHVGHWISDKLKHKTRSNVGETYTQHT
ncbi:MAG: hydroxymethylglutaryl-CoA lyase [Legionellales bacterium]|nr:hydroxymethylglutaryl-CoA lyase [Legionellales bacterium]